MHTKYDIKTFISRINNTVKEKPDWHKNLNTDNTVNIQQYGNVLANVKRTQAHSSHMHTT